MQWNIKTLTDIGIIFVTFLLFSIITISEHIILFPKEELDCVFYILFKKREFYEHSLIL